MKRFNLKGLLFIVSLLLASSVKSYSAGEGTAPIKVDWSFKGITGKFDRASLQRGFQVYRKFVLLVTQCNI
jgi:ubiquinol-cytochrome c reductase cytochrome c1 subunit